MKKIICLMLTIVLLAGLLAGCSKKNENIFAADDEILTYQKIDPSKTQLVVARIGNIPVSALCEAFEEANPDTQVIYLDITGGDANYIPFWDWMEKGYKPDVVLSGAGFSDDELTKKYFENLSDNPVVKEYEAAALQRTAIDGYVYWLPGPSDINAMIYNKTLFDQYGWEVPTTFDEFVSLCDQIREDTNGEIEPWNPNAKYDNELTTALESMCYEDLLGGLDNRTWYNNFIDGKATFAEHMKPYADMVQTLIDHDILREEHFSYSATTRGKEFNAGKIAMYNAVLYNPDNEQFDYDYMPFPTTKGNQGYLCDSYSCYVGLPIKEHTEKQNDAISRFLEFFSSAKGQQTYIGKGLKVSNIKGEELNQDDSLASLQPSIKAGNLFGRLDFRKDNKGPMLASPHQIAKKMTTGEMTGDECLAAVDAPKPSQTEGEQEEAPEVLATASENFTILESSFLIADMYRGTADADIGLITHNNIYCGNMMRVFAGEITPYFVHVLKPRSLANDSTLVKVSMTGQQIMDALNNPMWNDQAQNCIYAYSGLKCEVTPWNELGTKYLSVKLADGSELQMDKLYTVAFWSGTVSDEYITETLQTYEGTWEELMTAKLKADGTIKPADDGRIKLVWETK